MGVLLNWTGRGLTVFLVLMVIAAVVSLLQADWGGAASCVIVAVILVGVMRGLAWFTEQIDCGVG